MSSRSSESSKSSKSPESLKILTHSSNLKMVEMKKRNEEEYEHAMFSEEETSATGSGQNSVVFDEETVKNLLEIAEEEEEEARSISSSKDLSFYSLTQSESEEDSNQENHHQEEEEETISMAGGSKSFRFKVNNPAITTRARTACTSFRYVGDEPSLRVTKKIAFVLDDDKLEEKYCETGKKIESNLTQVDKFLNMTQLNSVTKKFELEDKDKEEIFGDTNMVGSTSKSSSEWLSSINCRDPSYDSFSSSSWRSCPNWESYTVFQKYNEEMLFLKKLNMLRFNINHTANHV